MNNNQKQNLEAVVQHCAKSFKMKVTNRSDHGKNMQYVTLLNSEDGVSIRAACRTRRDHKTQRDGFTISLDFLYRGRGSGYRNHAYKNYPSDQSLKKFLTLVDKSYAETRDKANEFRQQIEKEQNLPLVGYKCQSPVVHDVGRATIANVTIQSCRIYDAVTMRNRRVYRDVEVPNAGEPYFLAFCVDPQNAQFAIITDGEVIHPTMPIDGRKWRRNEQKSIAILHKHPKIDLSHLSSIDQAVLERAIKRFLDDE